MTEKPDYMQMALEAADDANAFRHYLRPDSAQRAECLSCLADNFSVESINHKPGCVTKAMIEVNARTLEALDTERTAHEATKRLVTDHSMKVDAETRRADKAEAELQALREGVADVMQGASALKHQGNCTSVAAYPDTCGCGLTQHRLALRSLLPQPAADPLVEAIKDCGYATLDCIEPEFAAALREALARHGLTITEKQG